MFLLGALAGWFAYHLVMNRTVMMRACCVKHFATHAECNCRDCCADRVLR